MAAPQKLRVMISSRCSDPISLHGKHVSLSVLRQAVKQELESEQLLGSQLFDVWINEDAPPAPGTEDSWDHCMRQVEQADLVLFLYNGNSGWARNGGEIGICHGELQRALEHAPGKVLAIELPPALLRRGGDRLRDELFRQYVARHNLFRGKSAGSGEEVIECCRQALREAVASMARIGGHSMRKGRGYTGDALAWSRLSYAKRSEMIEQTLRAALVERDGAEMHDDQVFVPIQGKPILTICHGIPAGMGVPAARELVGQPFLQDHRLAPLLIHGDGPVHLIGCAESISKAQAMKILGFPDAMIVDSPFGVYVASDIQKIQLVFLRNCTDDSATRVGVQRLFEWLEQWGEAPRLTERAAQRGEIVRATANVNLPASDLRKPSQRAVAAQVSSRMKAESGHFS